MRLVTKDAKRIIGALCLIATSLTVTSASAQTALNQLESQLRGAAATRSAEPGFLGLIADDRQENNGGVRVLDCMPGGPADASGLKPGDLITSVGVTQVRSMSDFATALRGMGPGAVLVVQVQRGGVPTSVSVRLGNRPSTPAGANTSNSGAPSASPAVSTSLSPILPQPTPSTSSDAARIDALEKRIVDLERRLADLEQAARGPTLSSP